MAEALARRGHELHVVTYHLGTPLDPDVPYQIHRTPRVPTYNKESPGPTPQKFVVMDPLLQRTLARVLREHNIDIIHAHHYEGVLVARAAARRRRTPVVYDAHTLLETELSHYLPGPLRGIASRVGGWLDLTLPRGVAHVISVSAAIRDRLVESGAMPPERVTVVGNGVEQDHFDVAVREHRPGDVERIIFTGNLAPYQGVDLMLAAFRQVQARRGGVRLSIVTASSFEPYEALALELGIRDAIDLVPASFERLPHDLADSAVALNPRTKCDGIPLKLLNYMSAARPIVSFEGSAHGLEHEKTALVVPDGDTEAFAAAVVQLLEQPVMAARLGANARRTSRERHSWDSTAHRVEMVYERVLG